MIRTERRWRRQIRGARRKTVRPVCELMERRELLSAIVVSNTSDSSNPSQYSLRWAILQVNAQTGPSTIQFDIPGGGPQSIQLTSPLPPIVNSVVIDGTSQPSYQG